ncbi:anthranilate synthase family protein [Streptomyces sp. NPDC050418]|uniref:anthranilate synthase family protein n=1 Tax=Streptomyces sp. NPDC050418 TaxID=3365612 RepID=UPI0037B1354D
MSGLLERVLSDPPPAYALLHRSDAPDPDRIDVLTGDMTPLASLGDLASLEACGGGPHEHLVMVPYRQLAERGYACPDDGAPLLAMTVTGQETRPLSEALALLPRLPTPLTGKHFDTDDETYADLVRAVLRDAIGTGEGANFVLRRFFVADITDYGPRSAPAFFRRLLLSESGAYWTFLIHTGERTFVGASPERHISVDRGHAVMNPISGTYRYPPGGPTLPGVLDFLDDPKETDELSMVVDEELKMMTRICPSGARVRGPYLKEMARLAHTEYFIEGVTDRAPHEILYETMFAPTVTGSPLQSACRVIARHEPGGRGYYSGLAALIGRDEDGGRALDSAILIRTADIGRTGRLRIGVGSTLVRHSDPAAEVAETRAKAAGLLAALEPGAGDTSPAHGSEPVPRPSLAAHPRVRAALEQRNERLAGFWLRPRQPGAGHPPQAPALPGLDGLPGLPGHTVLVIDMEDTFTAMIAEQLRSLGLRVTVRRYDETYTFDGYDLVVLGPGPGDPAAPGRRMTALRASVRTLLATRRPFVAVCLSHQVLCRQLGLRLVRKDTPNQGVQHEIDFFGERVRVGFYNTYAARSSTDRLHTGGAGAVAVCRDAATGEVHALRGPHFASVQFHPESVLTEDGPRLLGQAAGVALGHLSEQPALLEPPTRARPSRHPVHASAPGPDSA